LAPEFRKDNSRNLWLIEESVGKKRDFARWIYRLMDHKGKNLLYDLKIRRV